MKKKKSKAERMFQGKEGFQRMNFLYQVISTFLHNLSNSSIALFLLFVLVFP